MNGDKRNFSLSIWDHKDNFICNLKSANSDFEGQSYNENFTENVNGEKTLTFSIPMYIFSYEKNENGEDNFNFKLNNPWNQNEIWKQIKNEQKIRYIEYNPITNEPERIEEFVLKEFTESRNGEQKIAECVCESLAIYELGKVGWTITFDTNYVTDYELGSHEVNINGTSTLINNCEDLLTLDYWMKKILYKETNLGRVSNTTECTYLLQGLQLRDNEGYPINQEIISITTSITREAEYKYDRIEEPICIDINSEEFQKYYNPTGWHWEVQAKFENDPEKQSISTLYEIPVINQFIETYPDYFVAQSYQKRIGSNDNTKELRIHPIPEYELNEWTYVTDVKKRLISEERSNIFSIIQNLCETFGIWAYFQYQYSNDGKIKDRKILFKTETIDENIKFDFSYGKNLKSCSRFKNSNDLITKLYVTNAESNLVEGNILSIQQSIANPTNENYIYNFDYFYNCGLLSTIINKGKDSDEYKINLHYGKLRDLNNKISNIQNFLTPLYDRQGVLEGDLNIQEGSEIGYMDNIQSIQDKIDAIPPNDRLIKSWSADNNQYNHVGELKTYSNTTNPNGTITDNNWIYINFGREDILINNLEYDKYYFNEEKTELIKEEIETLSGFTPRIFAYSSWHSGSDKIEDNIGIPTFIMLDPNSNCIYDYSTIGNGSFIKGIYLNTSIVGNNKYGRIRYKYAPLAYYYLLVKDYWDKIGNEQIQINNTQNNLLDIKNKILLYELRLKKLLQEKNELILQFENKYKPFIREGYWEPSDYQSQFIEEKFDTNNSTNFTYFSNKSVRLDTLNLNDSLSTYSYYFSLGNANEIDIDSIKMRILSKVDSNTDMYVPQYQGNNYELYLSGTNLICAIDPDIIYNYENIKNIPSTSTEYYRTEVDYFKKNGELVKSLKKDWIKTPINVNIPKIYLNNENIVTDKLKVYGEQITLNESNLLSPYEDYTYLYESVGYNNNGDWVNLSEQDSYSTEIQYKYSFRIDFKLTNNTLRFLAQEEPHFIVTFGEETTLQYIYNDSVATSKKYSTPQVEYNISVVDLSSLNGYENYKPKLGQKVPIYDPEMGFINNFEGFITSISYPLEEKYNTEVTIATYSTKFEDIFQKLTATVTDINYNSNEIYNAANSFESNGNIKTEVFKKSLHDNFEAVNLGINNEITIDKTTGITLHDKDNDSGVKLIGRGIFLTKDITKDDNTEWKTGITGEGINTSALMAGSLDTKQITIWNSSEKQARFVWNEQGLFAYGDKFGDEEELNGVSTHQELIDYNKYVRYNQEGLEFNDNGISALSLGWQGLKIQAQNEALELNATNGLILKQWDDTKTSFTTRLELGKLDNGNLYGLRLRDINGIPTFQSDSRGDLWLHQHIRLGGNINSNNIVQNPTAGIYGLGTDVPYSMQMGIRRNNEGIIIWDTTPIRFWAGPQTKNSYITNIHASTTEVTNAKINGTEDAKTGGNIFKGNEVKDNDPTLAKFKVSANGDIIASGIDVGGWIGEGDKLRSYDNEAILRSNGYIGNNKEYPLIAVGANNDTSYGTDYNFRVYQDGRLNLTKNGTGFYTGIISPQNSTDIVFYTGTNQNPKNSQFKVLANGDVYASNLYIGTTTLNNYIDESLDTVGGFENKSDRLTKTIDSNYTVAMQKPTTSGTKVFYAGSNDSPQFYVQADGYLYAQNAYIEGKITSSEGKIGGWTINADSLTTSTANGFIKLASPSTSDSLVIQVGTNSTNTSFGVHANGLVEAGNIIISGGKIGNLNLSDQGLAYTNSDKIVGMYPQAGTTNKAFLAGTSGNPEFYVTGNGYLYAKNAYIEGEISASTGDIGGWNIGQNVLYKGSGNNYVALYPKEDSSNTSPVIYIGNPSNSTASSNSNIKFRVTSDGSVYFHGGVYGWSSSGFKKGITEGAASLWTTNGSTLQIEICQGLIIDMR